MTSEEKLRAIETFKKALKNTGEKDHLKAVAIVVRRSPAIHAEYLAATNKNYR